VRHGRCARAMNKPLPISFLLTVTPGSPRPSSAGTAPRDPRATPRRTASSRRRAAQACTSTAMVRSRGRCPRGVRLIGLVPQSLRRDPSPARSHRDRARIRACCLDLNTGVSRMVATEFEYMHGVCRSIFDLWQEVLVALWKNIKLLDATTKKKELNAARASRAAFARAAEASARSSEIRLRTEPRLQPRWYPPGVRWPSLAIMSLFQ
jgi:hypothetical protein